MTFLLLDSSLMTSVILLHHMGRSHCLFFESKPNENSPPFSHTLASHVKTLFQTFDSSSEITLNMLNGIMCGLGPGSYTGIRASLSFAEGLRCGLKIPLGGFCSLKCLVNDLPETKQWPRVLDARSGGVYVAYPGETLPIKVSSNLLRQWVQQQAGILSPDAESLRRRSELKDLLDLPILEGRLDPDLLVLEASGAVLSLNEPLSPYYLGKGHSLPNLP